MCLVNLIRRVSAMALFTTGSFASTELALDIVLRNLVRDLSRSHNAHERDRADDSVGGGDGRACGIRWR